ncbi:mammalian cell entry protein [Mycobacterium intracellulare subsp. yongonense]|nr:mammalian cell entry protein [Mycobacterium intracellulare subsp. yongonense]
MLGGAAIFALLGGLVGWLGYQRYADHRAAESRAAIVAVARQGAVNLTTIDFNTADADIKRILDGATGKFRQDFADRSQPFVEVVKQVKSKSVGTVTAAGVESDDGNQAQVLVAMSVKTATEAEPQQDPREWRMRLNVQRVDGGLKVADVQFVP